MKVIRYQVHSKDTVHTIGNITKLVKNRNKKNYNSMDGNHTITLLDIY